MVNTVIHTLIELTNRFVEADENFSARENRAKLVEAAFPFLSETEKEELILMTQFEGILRAVRDAFGEGYPQEEYKELTRAIIATLSREEARTKPKIYIEPPLPSFDHERRRGADNDTDPHP